MKQPTSPVQTSSKAGHAAGFTFIEVLVALAVSALIAGAACSGLITALQAERTAHHLVQGRLHIQQLSSRVMSNTEPAFTNTEWSVVSETTTSVNSTNDLQWTVWIFSPVDHPSLALKTALRSR